MDLIYGDTSDNDGLDFGLPVHLPTEGGAEQVNEKTVEDDVQSVEENVRSIEEETLQPIEIPGVNLHTQVDIDKWIEQRKANWMKRISNKRTPAPEEIQPEEIEPEIKQSSGKQSPKRRGRTDTEPMKRQRQQQQQHPKGSSKFNLNRSLIQRELASSENEQILAFIKALFESKTLALQRS
jgi:hypothetical protein